MPHRPYQNIPTLNPTHPLPLRPGKTTDVEFPVGSDLSSLAQQDTPTITLRLQVKKATAENLIFTLNQQPLTSPRANGDWLEFPLKPDQLRQGQNHVTMTLSKGTDPALWTDLHCTVRWNRASN